MFCRSIIAAPAAPACIPPAAPHLIRLSWSHSDPTEGQDWCEGQLPHTDMFTRGPTDSQAAACTPTYTQVSLAHLHADSPARTHTHSPLLPPLPARLSVPSRLSLRAVTARQLRAQVRYPEPNRTTPSRGIPNQTGPDRARPNRTAPRRGPRPGPRRADPSRAGRVRAEPLGDPRAWQSCPAPPARAGLSA